MSHCKDSGLYCLYLKIVKFYYVKQLNYLQSQIFLILQLLGVRKIYIYSYFGKEQSKSSGPRKNACFRVQELIWMQLKMVQTQVSLNLLKEDLFRFQSNSSHFRYQEYSSQRSEILTCSDTSHQSLQVILTIILKSLYHRYLYYK